MKYLEWGIGLVLIFISFSGYFLFLAQEIKIRIEFIPIVLCSTVGCVVFTAGLLNMLLESTFIILLAGGILFYIEMKKNRFRCSYIFTPGIVLFFILTVIILILSKGMRFSQWDNFSHWALVVKQILQNNRFPNFSDVLITFQAYPTGSASFIYFICRIVGDSEGVMFFAHNLLLISATTCLGAFIKKNKVTNYIILSITTLFLLSYNTYVEGLMVDNLLPMLGIAGIAILYYYRHEIRLGMILVLPIFILLVEIKNSGIFFAAIGGCAACYIVKSHKSRKNIYVLLSLLSLPVLWMWLWKRHVALVFSDGAESLHAMSINNFSHIFKEKTVQDIKDIITMYLKEVFSISRNEVWIFLLILIIIWILLYLKKNMGLLFKFNRLFLLSFVTYVCWHLSLLATYVFSMPLDEALRLASYERYHKTVIIYLFGVWIIFILDVILKGNKGIFQGINAVCLVCALSGMIIVTKNSIQTSAKTHEEVLARRDKVVNAIEKNQVPSGGNYILYTKESESGYLYFVSRYELNTLNLAMLTPQNVEEFQQWDEYNYLLMLEPSSSLEKELMDKNEIKVVTP